MSQMLPEDMMALMGPQGNVAVAPAPAMGPPPGGGIPPDMAAMMGPPPAEAGPTPEEDASGALHGGSAAVGDPNELVAQAIDLLEQAAKAQPEDQIINTYLKSITQLQGTLASAEKAADTGDIRPQLAAETSY